MDGAQYRVGKYWTVTLGACRSIWPMPKGPAFVAIPKAWTRPHFSSNVIFIFLSTAAHQEINRSDQTLITLTAGCAFDQIGAQCCCYLVAEFFQLQFCCVSNKVFVIDNKDGLLSSHRQILTGTPYGFLTIWRVP